MSGWRVTVLLAAAGAFAATAGVQAACGPQFSWTRSYTSVGNNTDPANAVAVDASGNIWVAGYETVGPSDTNWLIREYDSGGSALGSTFFDGSSNGYDGANAIAVAKNGDIVGAGYELDGQQKLLVIRYDASRNILWSRTYRDPGAGASVQGRAVAVDGSGNVAVAGFDYWGVGQSYNWVVLKWDASGNLLWTRTLNGADSGEDRAAAAAFDSGGNLYCVGSLYVAGQDRNWLIRKYDSSGNVLWDATAAGLGTSPDRPVAAVVLADDSVCVAGNLGGSPVLRRYDSSGNLLGSGSIGSSTSLDVSAMALASDGNLLVAGSDGLNGILIKVDLTGNLLWTTAVVGHGAGSSAAGVASGPSGSVSVAGWEDRADLGQDYNWRIVRFIQPATCTAGLEVSVATSPATPIAGNPFQVTVTATNASGGVLYGVTPTLDLQGTPAWLMPVAGPVPASTPTMASNAVQTFVWTFSPTASGTVDFASWLGYAVTSGDQVVVLGTSPARIQAAFRTIDQAVRENEPGDGKIQVRCNVVRMARGEVARIVAHGTPGGTVDLVLMGPSGAYLGKLASITLAGDGIGSSVFNGRVEGKKLRSGTYWIVAGGAVKDRNPVMVIANE